MKNKNRKVKNSAVADIIEILKKRHGKKYKKVLRELTNQIICKNPKGNFYDLLKCHRSTKERFGFYHILYRKLEKLVDFDNIIDLGCGLNPFSVIFMNKKPKKYYAIDIDEKVLEILNKNKNEFLKMGIDLEVINQDVIFNLNKLKFDGKYTIFLFKNILIFKRINKEFVKEFLDFFDRYGKYAIISVSKYSFSGKRELPTKEKLKKLFDYDYELEFPNEYFIIIKRG